MMILKSIKLMIIEITVMRVKILMIIRVALVIITMIGEEQII